jgi:hypothetical protein
VVYNSSICDLQHHNVIVCYDATFSCGDMCWIASDEDLADDSRSEYKCVVVLAKDRSIFKADRVVY